MSTVERRRRERRGTGRRGITVFELGNRLRELEVIVCAGSGGVGKTTISAALAMAVAAAGDKRVLVLTVDPARRLATALGLQGLGSEPVEVPRQRLHDAGLPAHTITSSSRSRLPSSNTVMPRLPVPRRSRRRRSTVLMTARPPARRRPVAWWPVPGAPP